MFLEILLLIVTVIVILTILNSRSLKNLPPGPSPIFPVVGNIPQLIKYRADETSRETVDKLVAIYGPIVYIKLGKIAQVVVQDLTLAKAVLSSEVWTDRVFDEYIGERSWGKNLGIIFSWGDNWKEMRRFSMRTLRDFGFGRATSMEGVMDEEISALTTTLDTFATSRAEVGMHQFFTVSILNVLWSMVAGSRFSHDDTKLKQLINLIDETSKSNPAKASAIQAFPFLYPIIKHGPRFQRRRVFIQALQSFFRESLDERRQDGGYRSGSPKDFIDVFLQEIDTHAKNGSHPNFYTDEQFIMVCYDLFIAGAETTSNTLEFAMLYMALHPDVQVKVQEEIDRVVGRNRKVTLEDKEKMPYTEATILEIQRLANILPAIVRGCHQDTEISGYHIPKGTIAAISISSLHNDPEWGDPDNFRPERFLDSENNVINAHKILAFGGGKRVCLGEALARASLFLYFASLLQRFSLKGSPTRPPLSKDPVYGFTLSPQKYWLNFKLRLE